MGGFENEEDNMEIKYRIWSAQRAWISYRVIFPGAAGVILIAASLLPWLVDPLGVRFSAWMLPIDLGWQIRNGAFNYGVLSLACAFYAFLVTFRVWNALKTEAAQASESSVAPHTFIAGKELALAALLCLLPLGLFFLQYLFIDLTSTTTLIQHQLQASFIKTHLGYGSAATFFAIDPTTADPLSFSSRAAVVINNLAPGLFLPLLSAFLLLVSSNFWPKLAVRNSVHGSQRGRIGWILGGVLLAGFVLGRGPAALFSNYEAQHALSTGNYTDALSWLDTARLLNPALDQMAAYHIERGQAWYYLRPGEENEEAILYLSSTYQQQKDYLSAYEELMVAWNNYSKETWIQDDLRTTLTRLAEQSKPVMGAPATLLSRDNPALPWLQQLVQLDPTNAYGHYMLGRIFYDEHNYTNSFSEMQTTVDLVHDTNFQSVAYTYLGLNSEMLGSPVQARNYLFQAVELDIGYHNNTARQELSGIR